MYIYARRHPRQKLIYMTRLISLLYFFILKALFLYCFALLGNLALAEKLILLDGKPVVSLQEAMKEAVQGSLITLSAGIYKDGGVLKAHDVTIRGEKGTHLKGFSTKGKGTLVIQGENTEIIDIECSQVSVLDKNGACVRLEGKNLQLRNVYFHDSEQGLLSGKNSGLILIENSRFERLGYGGQAHGIYVGSGKLFIQGSRFLSSKGEGHEIKSRAEETVIQDTIIASLDGEDSRLVDIPNGGVLEINDCILQQGNNTSNRDLIGYGLEGIKFKNNSLTISNNLFLLDNDRGNRLLRSKKRIKTTMMNNIVIGKLTGEVDKKRNFIYQSRKVLGIPTSPIIPNKYLN